MKKTFALFELPHARSKYEFSMHAIELKDVIPFEVKRVYFITDSAKGLTGQHCHFIEEELFFLTNGTGTLVIDRGNGREDIALIGGKNAAYVPSYVWHGFKDLSKDAVVVALSSTNYSPDRSDYLEDYEAYLQLRDKHL